MNGYTAASKKHLQDRKLALEIAKLEKEIVKLDNDAIKFAFELEGFSYAKWERSFWVRVRELASGIFITAGMASVGLSCYNAVTSKAVNVGAALIHPPWYATGLLLFTGLMFFALALLVKPRYA